MFSFVLTFLVFVFILGVLVFVHELGHFLVAKWVGMRVDEFAIGFPPRLFSKKKGETLYSINALPFGGYVKIRGENAGSEGVDGGVEEDIDLGDKKKQKLIEKKQKEIDPRSFGQKSVWARIAVLISGVGMNIIFAFIVLGVAFSVGFISISQNLEDIKGATIKRSEILIGAVLPDSASEKAGIQAGDIVKKVTANGQEQIVYSINDLIGFTKSAQLGGVTDIFLSIERDGDLLEKKAVIANDGRPPLGAEIQALNIVKVPVYIAPVVAVKEIYAVTGMTWSALKSFGGKLFIKGEIDSNVSGPVGVYKATGVATKQGFLSIVFLTVMLSINLAILNIMPIPALDGGKLVFLATEAIFKKRVIKEEVEQILTLIGFGLLILLMLVLTIKDFYKL